MIEKIIELLIKESKQSLTAEFYKLSKKDQFRSLCNVRPPLSAGTELLELQDEYLQRKTVERGVVVVGGFQYVDSIALWQGDITRLNADAIVNACNAQLLGCFLPLHNCIDNIIHTNAGVQVRIDCSDIMKGCELQNGDVRVTSAYNLPSKYIFHTVGPIVDNGTPNAQNMSDLKGCYINSLNKAVELGVETIAFCSISTGVYGYPKEEACKLAVESVREWLINNTGVKVVFNVYVDEDRGYYERELSR